MTTETAVTQVKPIKKPAAKRAACVYTSQLMPFLEKAAPSKAEEDTATGASNNEDSLQDIAEVSEGEGASLDSPYRS